jgi:hypothetical protein
LDDGSTLRQARVDDDVWGEDLDANTVEECFILASQALSQVRTPDEVKQLGDSWSRSSDSPQLEFLMLYSLTQCLQFFFVFALHNWIN